eukprot:148124-Pelagomonas_calceolata.AAC.17
MKGTKKGVLGVSAPVVLGLHGSSALDLVKGTQVASALAILFSFDGVGGVITAYVAFSFFTSAYPSLCMHMGMEFQAYPKEKKKNQ